MIRGSYGSASKLNPLICVFCSLVLDWLGFLAQCFLGAVLLWNVMAFVAVSLESVNDGVHEFDCFWNRR